jgi:hypothetical protein
MSKKARKKIVGNEKDLQVPFSYMNFWDGTQFTPRDSEDFFKEKSTKEFLNYCKANRIDFDLYVIAPLGKFAKYKVNIVVFPLSKVIFGKDGLGEVWVMEDTVLFKGELHSHTHFFRSFRENEMVNTHRLLECIKPPLIIRVPISLLGMPSELFSGIKKICLTPIRSFLSKMNIVDEGRGKSNQKLIKERNKVIRNEYEEIMKKGRIKWEVICVKIKNKLSEYAESIKYYNRPVEAKIIDRVFNISNTQIWRTIQKFHKK